MGEKRRNSHLVKRALCPVPSRGVLYFYLLFVGKRIKSILSSFVSIRFIFLSTAWHDEMRARAHHPSEFGKSMTLNFPYFSQQIGNSIGWGRLHDVKCDSSLIIFEFEEFKVNCWIMCVYDSLWHNYGATRKAARQLYVAQCRRTSSPIISRLRTIFEAIKINDLKIFINKSLV